MSEYEKNKNMNADVLENESAMEEEVGTDSSAHADFMTQNIVSNTVDAAMAEMVSNVNAGSSSSLK